MIKRKLIIKKIKKQINIAILENNILVEYYNNKNKNINLGDIYIGRIIYIYKGMNSVFLDIGYYKYGYLNFDDIGNFFLSLKNKKILYINIKKSTNVKNIFKLGQYIIVQIIKPSIYNKGPKLTCKIKLIGRYVIFIPYNNKNLISKKIKDKGKFKKILKYIKLSKSNGYIIRTLAKKQNIKNIKFELYILLKIWRKIFLKIKKKKIQKIYTNNNILYNLLKNKNIKYNKIISNNYKICRYLEIYFFIFYKKKIKNLKYYKCKNIFEKYGIEKQKKILFSKYIYLSDGSNLIIEKTEALNVIDINSNMEKKYNPYKVNILALEEIVRQIRLRNMVGLIIIDLIDIKRKKYKKKIYKALKKLMKLDTIKHKILPPSKFNIIEITREKNYYSSSIYRYKKKTNKKKIDLNKYIKQIEFVLNYKINKKKNKIFLYVNPIIASYLKYGFYSYILKWYIYYNIWIEIIIVTKFKLLEYKFKTYNIKYKNADVVE